MLKKLEGFKTYSFAAAIFICGAIDLLNYYCGVDLKGCPKLPEIPPAVYPILATGVAWARSQIKAPK